MRFVTGIKTDDGTITHIISTSLKDGQFSQSELWTLDRAIKYLNMKGNLITLNIDESGIACFATVDIFQENTIRSTMNGIPVDNLLDLPRL